ncbi:hypothetical protein ID866_11611 [Astraeus odoratus]|nr:hypothetical protein ID866_11611 [Astraeus odoratus]
MSSPHCTSSFHECCLAKTKAPKECTEEEWKLVFEGKLDPVLSDDEKMAEMQDQEKKQRVEEEAKHLAHKEAMKKAQEEAERKAEEEHRVQEEAARAREEAERLAKEATAREEVAKRAAEAAEEGQMPRGGPLRSICGRRQVAKPSRRMMVVGPSTSGCRVFGVQDPCTRCCNKGTPCVLGMAKEKTMACKACCHAKVSCSWIKKTAGESRKWKQMWRSEEAEEVEAIDVDEDKDKEQLHFVVPQHLAEQHQDTLRALIMTLDTLSTDFLEFWQDSWNLGVATLRAIETITNELQRVNDLKEEEMGRSKGKGKEKAQGEIRRARMEDDDGDMEMGRAGPSSLA